jgi:hypothetical protein
MRTVAACSLVFLCDASLGASQEDLLHDLDNARTSWAVYGSPDYQFTITTSCICTPLASLGPTQVTVKGGKVVRSVYIGSQRKGYTHGRRIPPDTKIPNVPELFKKIEWEISTRPSKSGGFSVQYDISDGHPVRFQYDDTADDAFTIVLSNFRRR